MPSCSHSCRVLALEGTKAHIAITAARYTRQETLPTLLLRHCPIFSLGCSAFLFPLKPRTLELRRPSRYMEASYMEARVYLRFVNSNKIYLIAFEDIIFITKSKGISKRLKNAVDRIFRNALDNVIYILNEP